MFITIPAVSSPAMTKMSTKNVSTFAHPMQIVKQMIETQ